MENTLENKAKFFAQYWGQELIQFENCGGTITIFNVSDMNVGGFDGEEWLELKPLSSITDEDMKGLMDLNEIKYPDFEENKEALKELFNSNGFAIDSFTDFLRSKGYALPYMRLSIEKLLEFGWIKLKSE